MKLKKELDVQTDDFWYDLTEGYLVPEEICENPEDAKKVKNALKVLMEFEEDCIKQIEDFLG